jgi:hypothetical protein
LYVGIVSGLHWTIPNGASAPGNVLPPPEVQVRVSTRLATLPAAGALPTVLWLRAPAGRREAGTGRAQWVGRPVTVVTQLGK